MGMINFTKKEISWIIIAIIIAGFIGLLPLTSDESPSSFLMALAIFAIIILTTVIVKKIVADRVSISIEHKIWEMQRFSIAERSKLKKPIPMGLIFPFLISILSQGVLGGILRPFTILQFDAKNVFEKRLLKARQGEHRHLRKTEMNESDPAMVAGAGFYVLILLAIIGVIIKLPELTRYSIYYGIWNMIPISKLDGAKLFFGSPLNWMILAIMFIISLVLITIF